MGNISFYLLKELIHLIATGHNCSLALNTAKVVVKHQSINKNTMNYIGIVLKFLLYSMIILSSFHIIHMRSLNQLLIKLRVRNPFMARCSRYTIMW